MLVDYKIQDNAAMNGVSYFFLLVFISSMWNYIKIKDLSEIQ